MGINMLGRVINMSIKTEFDLGQTVLIKAFNKEGIVTSILISHQGAKYEVRYFGDDYTPYEIHFYPNELKAVTKTNPLGVIK